MTATYEDAICASGRYDPDLWFAHGNSAHQVESAVRLCRACPALEACREYAMTGWVIERGPIGPVRVVIAGMTERELAAARAGGGAASPTTDPTGRMPRARSTRTCEREGCDRPYYSAGMCKPCYSLDRYYASKSRQVV